MNINRERYLDKVRPYYQKQLIKVLTGQRRVGKSYILQQVAEDIRNRHKRAHIIYIDKEQFEFDQIRNYRDLHQFVKNHSVDSMNYLFIDEIQEINGFEKALRSLLAKGNYDIYCTGSNAQLLSGELATLLSGRQISVHIYSLSFHEFKIFHQLEHNQETLMKYLKFGGLPYLIHLPLTEEIIFDYLKNINATILFRDIVSRYEIRDVAFLTNLLRFIADNVGNLTAAKRISDYLKSLGDSKTPFVISNYLSYLENVFYIIRAQRQDIQGKRIFEYSSKFYFQDLGLRNAAAGFKPDDINKLIENVVFMHLLLNDYQVHVGKTGMKEVDFIAERQGEKTYVQATYLLSDNRIIEREFGNLLSIKDNYPKYVVSMDQFNAPGTYKGIKHLPLLDFLETTPS